MSTAWGILLLLSVSDSVDVILSLTHMPTSAICYKTHAWALRVLAEQHHPLDAKRLLHSAVLLFLPVESDICLTVC